MEQALQQHILSRFWIDNDGYIRRTFASRSKSAGSLVAVSTKKDSPHLIFCFAFEGKQKGLSYGRVAWLLHHGIAPAPSLEVDHIDRNPRNNRKDNLRLASRTEQVWNTRGYRNGPKNVYYNKNTKQWYVQLQVNGKIHGSYSFASEKEAAVEAEKMRAQHHGLFAFDSIAVTTATTQHMEAV